MKRDILNPLQGRKWLSLFESDKVSGLRFRPNLQIDDKYLGFSISTNEFGLRGPSNSYSSQVFMGTSFTMGMCVNNGENWYDYYIDKKNWLNLGLPIGIKESINLLRHVHKGERELLVYMYHPNIWYLSNRYDGVDYVNQDLIKQLGWKTDFLSSMILFLKKNLKDLFKYYNSELFFSEGYRINTKYFYFDLTKNSKKTSLYLENLENLFGLFKRVKLIRVPVKEQCLENGINKNLKPLLENYDYNYSFLSSNISMGNVEEIDLTQGYFDLNDYYKLDNHWNARGNRKFAEILKDHII